jgi:ornithine carbamoyltransferase
MNPTLEQRHLITFDTWTKQEIDTVLEVASHMKAMRARNEFTPFLHYKTLFMIFFEQSTRTRNSLEAAMTQLGGHAHDLTADKMQIAHGESPQDTAQVLARIGEGIAIRNCFYGVGSDYIRAVAQHSDIPVISMQDDVYHPLQVIADLMTIQECYGKDVRGLKIAITWAYAMTHAKPLSVPQSQILLFPRYGMDVVVAHPKEFSLQKNIVTRAMHRAEDADAKLSFVHNMEDAIRDADVVIPKNWGGFGFFDTYVDDEEQRMVMKVNLDRHRDWICDRKKFSLAKKDARVMHALPADRGHEVTDEVLDSENSVIYDEAENRLHTAKSILALLMRGTLS